MLSRIRRRMATPQHVYGTPFHARPQRRRGIAGALAYTLLALGALNLTSLRMAGGAVATASPDQAAGADAGSSAGMVPFIIGSNEYSEPVTTVTQLMDANVHEFVINITPGGFLRGVRLAVTSAGGVIGAGALTADSPWALFSSISLENIDGAPICYPMSGFAYYCVERFFRPWNADAALISGFSNSINPALTMTIRPEIRDTLGVLANTDSRALYRLRFTVATNTALATGGVTTYPTLTISVESETWAQVDSTDLQGFPIDPLPDGLAAATITRHDIQNLAAANGNNTIKFNNVGNEHRGILMITRDSNNARVDALAGTILWRDDNRTLLKELPANRIDRILRFYGIGFLQSARPAGVYVWPRFRVPGDHYGSYWLQTNNGTFLQWEFATAAGVTGIGTAELISNEVIPRPGAQIPTDLEGV